MRDTWDMFTPNNLCLRGATLNPILGNNTFFTLSPGLATLDTLGKYNHAVASPLRLNTIPLNGRTISAPHIQASGYLGCIEILAHMSKNLQILPVLGSG